MSSRDRVAIVTDESPPPALRVPGAAELQSRLFDLGYYDGPVDGRASERTVAALARFQHDHGLPVSGVADPVTMQAMYDSYCY